MGTFPFRFSPETRKLFLENGRYFSVLETALSESGLGLRGVDAEARSEFQILDNGQLEVTFVFPLDNNGNPDDGRIYLMDKFLFQEPGEAVKRFERTFSFNGQGAAGATWEKTLAAFKAVSLPDSDVVRAFASGPARSFARPVSPALFEALRGQSDFLVKAAEPFLAAHPQWKFKLKDPQNHFVLLPGAGKMGAVLSLVVDDDNDPPNGRIFLNETFLWDHATGRMISHGRQYTVAPEVSEPLKSELEATVAALNRTMDFSDAANREFLKALLPVMTAPPAGVWGAGDLEKYLARPPVGVVSGGTFRARAARNREWTARSAEAAAEVRDIQTHLELESGKALPAELSSALAQISREPDRAFRRRALLHFAKDELFQRRAWIGGAYYVAERLRADPDLKADAAAFSATLQGDGSFGAKLEALAPQALKHLASPPMLLAMVGAAGGGLAAEAAGLRWLRAYGTGGRWAAGALGVGGEAFAFTAFKKAGGLFFGTPETSDFFRDFAAGLLLFGAARLAHNGAAFVGARMGEGRLGEFWGGPHPELRGNPLGISPLGRAFFGRLAVGTEATAQWTWAGDTARKILTHGGGVGGMALASHLAKRWGWTPGSPQNAAGELADASLLYLQALAGFELANRAFNRELFSIQAEARMRMAELKGGFRPYRTPPVAAPKPPPATAAEPSRSEKSFQAFQTKDLPDARFFELFKGGTFNYHFPPDGRIFLDQVFFNQEGEQIVLQRDAEGNAFILDRRGGSAPVMVPGQEVPVFDLTQVLILHNRSHLEPGKEAPLEVGDELFFPGKRLRFSRPNRSPLAISLGLLTRSNQIDIFEIIDRAESLPDLVKELQVSRFEGASLLLANLQQVLSGQLSLFHLPVELGIFPKIKSLFEARVAAAEAEGTNPQDFTLRDLNLNKRWSVLETQFQTLDLLQDWKARMAEAQEAPEIARLLAEGPFSQIESVPVAQIVESFHKTMAQAKQRHAMRPEDEIRKIPVAGGLRQKARDMAEQQASDAYWEARQQGDLPYPADPELRKELIKLDNLKRTVLERVRTLDPAGAGLRGFTPEELEELVYQVLERGRPLLLLTQASNIRNDVELQQTRVIRAAEKHFPEDMKAKVSPFTGEKISEGDKEAQYRLAIQYWNREAGRLPFGTPSQKEKTDFIELIRHHLEPALAKDYFGAKSLLRRHLDESTKAVSVMLGKLSPEEKAVVLENYFGDSRQRELPPGQAFRVALTLGQAGMYREMGVTFLVEDMRFRAVLTLGEMGGVAAEGKREFFLLHTHSESYQPAAPAETFPETGQKTVALKPETKSPETRHVLPSQEDLRIYLAQAKEYFQFQNPIKFAASPFFDLKNRVFRTWIGSPMGLSEIQIHLSERGQATGLRIRFALSAEGKSGDWSYRQQKAELEKFSRELGVQVTVEEVKYADLTAALPYSL